MKRMEIEEVKTRGALRSFVRFPYELYRHDPNFALEPRLNQAKIFSPANPFFEHSRATLFLVRRRGKVAGRVAAIENRPHNALYGETTGFFGFFEAIRDEEVFDALLGAVIRWARAKGFSRLAGPTNFTTNDSCGFLVSGFNQPPAIHMPYNPEYYPRYFEQAGYRKLMDLYAYEVTGTGFDQRFPREVLSRLGQRLERDRITVRPVRFSAFDAETEAMCRMYNDSNAGNWGFIPLSLQEFRGMAKELQALIPEKLILLAERDQELIGYLVALPDFNHVFRHIRSGNLFPIGILRFLWFRRSIDNARVLILGVKKEYRHLGLDLALYHRIRQHLHSLGIEKTEASYVMETNTEMNHILQKLGGRLTKQYRMYYRDLNEP